MATENYEDSSKTPVTGPQGKERLTREMESRIFSYRPRGVGNIVEAYYEPLKVGFLLPGTYNIQDFPLPRYCLAQRETMNSSTTIAEKALLTQAP